MLHESYTAYQSVQIDSINNLRMYALVRLKTKTMQRQEKEEVEKGTRIRISKCRHSCAICGQFECEKWIHIEMLSQNVEMVSSVHSAKWHCSRIYLHSTFCFRVDSIRFSSLIFFSRTNFYYFVFCFIVKSSFAFRAIHRFWIASRFGVCVCCVLFFFSWQQPTRFYRPSV